MSVFKARQLHIVIALCSFAVIGAACGGDEPLPTLEPGSGALLELDISSPDFGHLEDIPVKFTCDGINESPRLEWGPVPEGTAALALIVDDWDAPRGVFSHWVVFDLPAESRGLAGNQPAIAALPAGGMQGANDVGNTGWTGPCPPPGPAHQYDFFLYALSSTLDLAPGASRNDVAQAMREAGVIGVGTFSGMYARR
jgi:hypothetical protein